MTIFCWGSTKNSITFSMENNPVSCLIIRMNPI